MKTSRQELALVFDIDLIALLIYRGFPIAKVSDESGRVGFWFDSEAVSDAQSELAAGSAVVEVQRWSAVVRRLHSNFLSAAAKSRLRAASEVING